MMQEALLVFTGAIVEGVVSALASNWSSRRQYIRETRVDIFRRLLPSVHDGGQDRPRPLSEAEDRGRNSSEPPSPLADGTGGMELDCGTWFETGISTCSRHDEAGPSTGNASATRSWLPRRLDCKYRFVAL
jgi:hypothetical protein